jgi:polar amino acid transport system substrate-binding protein
MPPIARRVSPHPFSPWRCTLAAALAGMALLQAGPAQAQACTQLQASGNPEYPPYLWRDPEDEGKLVGANAELMQWLAKEIGVPVDLRYSGPWGRVQEETRLGHVDLIAGAFFTQPRTEYMDYFHPAFHETRSVVWTRADAKLTYRRWADLTSVQGVTVINNSFGEEFDRYARENLYVTLSHRSNCNTPEMRGRIARALYKLNRDKTVMAGFVERGIQLWRKQTSKP